MDLKCAAQVCIEPYALGTVAEKYYRTQVTLLLRKAVRQCEIDPDDPRVMYEPMTCAPDQMHTDQFGVARFYLLQQYARIKGGPCT